MTDSSVTQKYSNDFLSEVEANVADGDWVRMCIQCGVCAGSCPLGDAWEHSPVELFMMIRAGKREEVLASESMWMCTSCYNCIVRCPSALPVTHIMHGLANYANRLGVAHEQNPTRRFARIFWKNIVKTGRVNELRLSLDLYFMDGFCDGVSKSLAMKDVGFGLLKTGRLDVMSLFRSAGIKDRAGLAKALKKAYEIEDARKGYTP